MTAVVSQPSTTSGRDSANAPITAGLLATSIIMTSTGTDNTPLITALHTRARIGLMAVKFSAVPTRVAARIKP